MNPVALSVFSIAAALSFTASSAKALTCYLLTDDNGLVTFDSAAPNAATAANIAGITAGFKLVGLDIRTTVQTINPANPGVGSLWAFATDGTDTNYKIYVIDPATAAATQVGGTLTGINGSGSGKNAWFFGFNPASDRIQMTNFQHNYQLDPNTITYVTQTSFTTFPNSNGSAFTTASFGGTSSAFFVDQTPNDTLYTSANISSGTATAVGDTGVSFSVGAGLDIADSTTLLAATSGVANLYTVNRATGAATMVGAIAGDPTIRALTILPASFPPTLSVAVKIKGHKKIKTPKRSRRIKGTASSQAGIKLVQFKIGKGKFKNAKGTTNWRFKARLKPHMNRISVQATGGNDMKSSIAKVRVIRQ